MSLLHRRILRPVCLGLTVACGLVSAHIASSQPYTFTTLAGKASYGSADGTGSNGQFYAPHGVAVDGTGNLYVADTSNHTIRRVTPGRAVSTLAGLAGWSGSADGTGSNARFYQPNGVAVDGEGNVYVADSGNHTVRKTTAAGVVSTLAGRPGYSGTMDGTGSGARFYQPNGIAVDSAGNVYVADTSNHTIRKITPAGVVSTLAGLAGATGSYDGTGSTAWFYEPNGVAVDSAGNVFVADTSNHTIRKITPAGVVSTLAGSATHAGSADGTGANARFYQPKSVAVDSAGNIYVADTGNYLIRKVTSDGVVTTLAGVAGSAGSTDGTGSDARFYYPSGVAVDSTGSIYVGDNLNHTIRRITPTRVVSTFAGLAIVSRGSVDSTGIGARFNYPYGIAADSAGNTYVADTYNHTIRKVTAGGVVSTLAGLAGSSGSADGSGSGARFYWPYGIAVDSGGNIYVADTYNQTIRRITSDGAVSTFAGLAGSAGSADGTGSSARFRTPSGVAVDSTGNVYVADKDNHTIRRITPTGGVSTLAGLAGNAAGTDGVGSSARFYWPSGVAVDSAGNVYVADSGNHTIRKIYPGGIVNTLAGLKTYNGSADGTGSNARFYSPSCVAVDSARNVYVGEWGNSTIRRITPGGVVSTPAGLAGSFNSGDGMGVSARFGRPQGIAVDPVGNVYVADTFNNTVRLGKNLPPLLSLSLSADQLVLSWPLAASNCVVEASSTLPPSPSWATLSSAVGVYGDRYVVTNDLEAGACFYRLRLP